jgi:hypothetical protein
MIIMTADHISRVLRRLADEHPGRIGHLFSGGKWFRDHLGPYALDNGRFTAGAEWHPLQVFDLYCRAGKMPTPPRFLLVPDVVGDWPATMREWGIWQPVLQQLGWPLAVAVQDGATAADVRTLPGVKVVFVGGSTRFKWSTFAQWCTQFPRVHIGRVNTPREAWRCWMAGAESIDGTGWMRTDVQREGLKQLLVAMDAGERPAPPTLFGCKETAA